MTVPNYDLDMTDDADQHRLRARRRQCSIARAPARSRWSISRASQATRRGAHTSPHPIMATAPRSGTPWTRAFLERARQAGQHCRQPSLGQGRRRCNRADIAFKPEELDIVKKAIDAGYLIYPVIVAGHARRARSCLRLQLRRIEPAVRGLHHSLVRCRRTLPRRHAVPQRLHRSGADRGRLETVEQSGAGSSGDRTGGAGSSEGGSCAAASGSNRRHAGAQRPDRGPGLHRVPEFLAQSPGRSCRACRTGCILRSV